MNTPQQETFESNLKVLLHQICNIAFDETLSFQSVPVVYQEIDHFISDTLNVNDFENIDCHRGCAHCCHLPIMCPPQLVFALSHFILQTFPKEQLKAFMERLSKIVHKYQTSTDPLSLREPCAFLADNRTCMIYEMRPFSCRSFTSPNVQLCQQLLQNPEDKSLEIEQEPKLFRIYQAATTALLAASQKKGRDPQQVFFLSALHHALQTPTIEQQWIDGATLTDMGEIS